MPGCGKSTAARLLAALTGREEIDTDKVFLDFSDGRTPAEVITAEGETAFRKLETEAVRSVAKLSGKIIATGGGAVLRGENVFRLKRNGKLFFLDRPLESLIPTEDRPLAKSADAIKKLYSERYGIYEAAADQRIGGERTVEETLKLIKDEIL
jgi:shikimate kinase